MMFSVWILASVTIYSSVATLAKPQESNTTTNNVPGKSLVDLNLFETDSIHADLRRLIVDLIEKMSPGHCYGLVFDAVYETVFTSELFESVNQVTRFIIKISQEEDTLNPQKALKYVLKDVQRAGCGGYIILLANGIQMERLLQFGDQTRSINTRARFIMTYDYRLFVPQLQYLWKRIVNVIFVRRLLDTVRTNSANRQVRLVNIPTYELSTVPFPLPTKGVFFTKILNIWQQGKFRLVNGIFFSDKTTNLGGKTMKVVVLQHTPAVFKSIGAIGMPVNDQWNHHTLPDNSSSFGVHTSPINYFGVEIELLKTISRAMQFRMEFYETPDSHLERWGTLRSNETITGLLGDMHEGRADFALADLHHTEYHLEFMDLSIPYNTECLTFLTPEALSDNSWKTLILPFREEMWAGILLSLFSVAFVFFTFSNILSYIHRNDRCYQPEYDLLQRHHKQLKTTYKQLDYTSKLSRWKNRLCNKMLSRKFARSSRPKRKNAKTMLEISSYYTKHNLRKIRMIPFKRRPEPWHDPLPEKDIFETFSGCIIYTYSMLLLVSLPRLPTGWPLRVLTGWYWVYCVLLVVAYRASFTAILTNPIPRLTIDTLQDLAASPIKCGGWGEQNILFFQKAQDLYSQAIGAKIENAPNANQAVEQVVEGMYAYYENIYVLRELRSTRKSEKARQTLHIMKQCVVHMPISIGLEKNSPLKHQVDGYIRTLVEGGLTGKWLSDAIERFQSNVEIPPQEATIDLKKMYAGIIALGLGYGVSMVAFIAEKLYWVFFIETSPFFDRYLFGFNFRKRG